VSAAAQRSSGRVPSSAVPAAPLSRGERTGELRVVPPIRQAEEAARRVERAPARRVQRAATAGSLFAPAVAVAAVVLAGLAVVAGHVLVARDQLRLDRLDGEVAAATLRNEQLRLEVAELSAPARLAAAARRLGLEVPSSVTYLEPVPLTPSASR